MSQRNRAYYGVEYIDGNTVRKTRPQESPRQERKPGRQTQISTGSTKALSMNGASVFFLAAVSFACIIMCVLYLNVQSNISETRNSISGLKRQISTVQSQNDALNYSINSYIDTDYIYKTAKNNLGMEQAGEDQIVTYRSSNSGYMVQYGDIPSK